MNFWEQTYQENINKLIGIGYRYTTNREIAEDLAHDAFTTAYQKAATFEGRGPFEAWLRRIMVNHCLHYLREQNKKKYLHDWLQNSAHIMETIPEVGKTINQDFTEDQLLHAINQLPPHHKLVFNLYVIDQFTHVQIGKELGISEGTSKSHLARARKKIKALLNEKSEKKKSFLPLLFWNVDAVFKKSFAHFELPHVKSFSMDMVNPDSSIAISKAAVPLISKSVVTFLTVSSIAVLSVVVLVQSKETKNNSKKTATVSADRIINSENNILTKNEDSMKNLKTLAAVFATSTVLALPVQAQDTLKAKINPASNQNQELNVKTNLNVQAEQNFNLNLHVKTEVNIDLSGTFYCESLFWSAENNELFFEGKSIINFGENNNIVNGKSSFLGKVSYLVVNGKPAKLNERIQLTNKKYILSRLSPKTATERFGVAGKNGAIVISLAE